MLGFPAKRALRGLASAILLASIAVPRSSADAQQAGLSLRKEMLAEGVYVFSAPEALDVWSSTNAVVIINNHDVTVFDSNTRPATARMVIAEIRKLTDKPVRTLINSHWHMDHWSGNDEYVKAFPGVQMVATIETRRYMERMGPAFFAAEIGLTRERARLDSAVRSGRQRDGSPLTTEARRALESDIARDSAFEAEVLSTPRILPTIAFRDSLLIWSGTREFVLFSATGDASGSAVMYLPKEKILVTGDVLVSPESGEGPPPWTTNSYSITPWLNSLREFDALDVAVIVPGQGPAMHDKSYLRNTIDLYASVISQVHAALERGLVKLADVQAAVNVDAIASRYSKSGAPPGPSFRRFLNDLTKKVFQESTDGAG